MLLFSMDVSNSLMEVTFDEDSKRVRESHEDISGGRAFLTEETAVQRPWGDSMLLSWRETKETSMTGVE